MRQFQRLIRPLIRPPLFLSNSSSRVIAKACVFHIRNTLCGFKHYCDKKEKFDWNIEADKEYDQVQQEYIGGVVNEHRILVIQPYVKWGKYKKRNTKPELQLAEAVSLIETLPEWRVVETKIVPVLSLKKTRMFGTGNLEILKRMAYQSNATALFVSTDLIKFGPLLQLQKDFDLPVYDRYSIIIHIFRIHATSSEAKLQVAIAELPYIRKKMHALAVTPNGDLNLDRRQKEIIDKRMKTLQEASMKLEKRRVQNKARRLSLEIPSVAIVGYTNAGKTSLIKALTGDSALEPKNQLFATLDTTVHKGDLPCNLEILYVDTIGFIQDVPEMLIKPFHVTLKDAMTADVIVHIFDISHPDVQAQVDHVHNTLKNMLDEKKSLIHVGNKCDLESSESSFKNEMPEGTLLISARELIGIDILRLKIEEEVLIATNRKRTRIRVKLGSPEQSWLYRKTTVVNIEEDPKSIEHAIMEVIVTDIMLKEFFAFLRTLT